MSVAACIFERDFVSLYGTKCGPCCWAKELISTEAQMPLLLWLIGVPLTVVVLLMLFGVVNF